ncbi:MAG TPA: XdhC family protein [Anaerolineales bacterium]|nr:XdhC family protein [Anaerolineales bacterium]
MNEIYRLILEALSGGEAVAVCTVIRHRGSVPRRSGSKMLVYADGRIQGSVGGGELESRVLEVALDALRDGQPRTLSYSMADPVRGDPGVCGGSLEVYVEPVQPEPTIVVAGGGHVGRAVVSLAAWLGYRVVLTDDRPDFCNPEAVPGADTYICCPLSELAQRMKITPYTYLILTTRNVGVDVEGLPDLLERPAAYFGVIGSKRRWQTARDKLQQMGVPEDRLARVNSPMGLELNAETPEEIALSILAEIVMLRRGGDGARMGA